MSTFGNTRRTRGARIVAPLLCVVVLVAPAAALAGPSAKTSDPFEPMNRAFFGFHQMVDHYVIRPAAVAYTRVMPKVIRNGLAHMASNLGEPAVFVNDVLQGRAGTAVKTLTRFTGNTTFGVLGFFDIATPAGIPHHPNDFGMTLARYGAPSGPYIFIPIAGPTTLRDAFGSAANMALNPLIFVRYAGDDAIGGTNVVSSGLETRADADDQLKALFASATDPYASFRSYYLQARQAEIFDGRIDVDTLPDLGPIDPPAAPVADRTPGSTQASGSQAVADAKPPSTIAPEMNSGTSSEAAGTVSGRTGPPSADTTTATAAEAPAPASITAPGAASVVAATTQATRVLVTPASLAHP